MAETESGEGALKAPDLRERGRGKDGAVQFSDRRLFMSLTAFGGCGQTRDLIKALAAARIESILYADFHDPRGAALLTMSEDPSFFVTGLRDFLNQPPFSRLELKSGLTMSGRTYALGYEPNLEDWLLSRPRRVVFNSRSSWAVWYPLRRSGAFALLPAEEQSKILKEHGAIGHAFGQAGLAQDIRLACHGMDPHDNDFVIGLIGPELAPLSSLVAAMRQTRQTATYIQGMGPFFIGKAIWRSSEGNT
ncbi:MAG: chlorite dismutase family protein [Elusimicrobiota bacterium]